MGVEGLFEIKGRRRRAKLLVMIIALSRFLMGRDMVISDPSGNIYLPIPFIKPFGAVAQGFSMRGVVGISENRFQVLLQRKGIGIPIGKFRPVYRIG